MSTNCVPSTGYTLHALVAHVSPTTGCKVSGRVCYCPTYATPTTPHPHPTPPGDSTLPPVELWHLQPYDTFWPVRCEPRVVFHFPEKASTCSLFQKAGNIPDESSIRLVWKWGWSEIQLPASLGGRGARASSNPVLYVTVVFRVLCYCTIT